MQDYLSFVKNLVTNFPDLNALQPVFGIGLENRIDEKPIHRLAGYRSATPVKTGSQVRVFQLASDAWLYRVTRANCAACWSDTGGKDQELWVIWTCRPLIFADVLRQALQEL
jgi:hypothetical protein